MSGGGFVDWAGPCCTTCGLPAILHADTIDRDRLCDEEVRLCSYGSGDLKSLARAVYDAAYGAGFKAGLKAQGDKS